jgi:colanic acid/amylovoran biosynthesis glycosyltransferase
MPTIPGAPWPRTAYVTLWFPKPSETFVAREVGDLARAGLPLTVFALYGPWRGPISPALAPDGVRVERIGTRSIPSIVAALAWWTRRDPPGVARLIAHVACRRWRSLEAMAENLWALMAGFHLARRCDALAVDIVHATWAGGPSTAAWVAAALTRRPYSMTGRAADIHPPDGFLEEKLSAAAFVRVEAHASVAHLARVQPSAAERIHTIYNGLTMEACEASAVRMQAPYRLLAIGRFVPKKAFDLLLHACAELVARGIDVRLTLAGDGREGRRLASLVGRLRLADRVSLPGFVPFDQVRSLYRDADMLVVPCRIDRGGDRDAIPTVIMEALVHRVPVVTTDVAGIGEVIEDGVTGRLVAAGDVRALADAIAATAADRSRAVAMAAVGRERVMRMCDRDRNARRLIDLLTSACDRAPASNADARGAQAR